MIYSSARSALLAGVKHNSQPIHRPPLHLPPPRQHQPQRLDLLRHPPPRRRLPLLRHQPLRPRCRRGLP